MSESAKKKMIQKKLPFALAVETAKKTSPTENSSPNVVKQSRKRKPSSDGDNLRSKKRVTDSKENISNQVVEVIDSDEDKMQVDTVAEMREDEQIKVQAAQKSSETTPTSVQRENVLHIKLPSHSKSKRKVNMDLKPPKSMHEANDDDSVVYLDGEELPSEKKTKKSVKRKKSAGAAKVKLTLGTKTLVEIAEQVVQDSADETNEKKEEEIQGSEIVKTDEVKETKVQDSKACEETITSIPTKTETPADDADTLHDEIIEMLSDDSEASAHNTSNLGGDLNKTPTASKLDVKNLTPKQLAWRQELESRRIEKELQRQKERDVKEQQRLKEKELREEAKRKEKEEKEEARKKEKDERDRKRQAEQEKKDEEKRIKEEERKRVADQREEEKRQKEEERKRQNELRDEEKRKRDEAAKKKEQEEEVRKKRAAEAFSKFFVPKKKTEVPSVAEDVPATNFMPFQVSERRQMAPVVRMQINKAQKTSLDENINTKETKAELYLSEIKSGKHKPIKFVKPLVADHEDETDVMLVDELEGAGEDIQVDESKLKMKHRAKFFSFTENRRPALHATWRKKSSLITPRRPLAQDTKFFDYEVDSDDEWEEEEPGESLHGSESEKEKDGEDDDYDIDNDFMVPHGHLSDEELQQNADDPIEDSHPEAQKAKLKILQQEFAAEMKKKTEKIKPRLIGCIWMNGDENEEGRNADKKYLCSDIIWRILKAREMMTSDDGVKLEEHLEPEVPEPDEELEKTPAAKQPPIRAKLNDEHVKDLIKLVHGNINSKKYLVREFNAYRLKHFYNNPDYQEFSARTVDEKMMEISVYKTCPEEGTMFGKKCWLVKPEIVSQHYGEEKMPLPNQWKYILQKEIKERKPRPVDESKLRPVDDSKPRPAEELKPEVSDAKPMAVNEAPAAPKPIAVKKRVQLLMSVPRDQDFSQTKKNNLISQYLKNGSSSSNQEDVKPADSKVVVID